MRQTTPRGRGRARRLVERSSTPARRVPADPAVPNLHAGKGCPSPLRPSLGDRVAEKDDGAPVLLDLAGPIGPPLAPQALEPVVAPDRPGAGQALVGGRDREALRLRGGLGGVRRSRRGKGEAGEQGVARRATGKEAEAARRGASSMGRILQACGRAVTARVLHTHGPGGATTRVERVAPGAGR